MIKSGYYSEGFIMTGCKWTGKRYLTGINGIDMKKLIHRVQVIVIYMLDPYMLSILKKLGSLLLISLIKKVKCYRCYPELNKSSMYYFNIDYHAKIRTQF